MLITLLQLNNEVRYGTTHVVNFRTNAGKVDKKCKRLCSIINFFMHFRLNSVLEFI